MTKFVLILAYLLGLTYLTCLEEIYYNHIVNSEDLFQPQHAKLAPEAPGAEQPTVGLFQPQLGQD